jgi:PAS domain S-box-containing protein
LNGKRTYNWRWAAANYPIAGAALVLLTWLCLWLKLNLATTAFAYLILVVLASLGRDRGASFVLSLAAAGCLDYLFAPPTYSLWLESPSDAALVMAFLTAALISSTLLGRSRTRAEEAVGSRQTLEAAFNENQALKNQLRITIDTIPTLVWAARANGAAEFLNERWLEYTGLTDDQALDWGWLEAVHPDDVSSLTERWRAIIASGQPGEAEARLRRFDGEYRWFLFRALPLRDESGNAVKWYGTNTDIEDRRRAEERTRKAEQELRAAIDTIPAFVWTTLSDGANDFHNQRLLSYTRISPEQATGGGWTAMFHPDDVPGHLERWNAAVAGGTSFEFESRLRRFDGEYRWFLARAEPLRDESGNIVKWYGTNIDIDDRRQAERALRRSEAYLAEAQRLSRTGSFGWTPHSGEIHWSEESFRIFERDPAVKPTIEFVLERIHPDDRARMGQEIDEASRGEKDFDVIHRLLMPDGSVKYVHVLSHTVKDTAGNLEVIGALRDITATKRTEDALRENEQRFRDYAEIASDWLWETGPDHRLTDISRRLKAIGIDPARAIGKTRWEAAGVEDEPEKWRRHKATLDAHQPFRAFTYKIEREDGSAVYVSISGKPTFGAEGQFLGYRGVGTDITAAARAEHAERALHLARAELSHVTRVSTLGALTASITHEVNQPLGAIAAGGEASLLWLTRGTPNIAEARSSIEQIIRDAHRASAVIRRTRELYKKADPEKARLDINSIINDTVLLVQREAISSGVALQLELASGLPAVRGDRVQLQQVIINLVINGIEAMATVSEAPRKLVIRSGRHQGDQIIVAVQDFGTGIAPENTNKLFNSFFTTKPNGMGMGLSICRTIIEAHGGRLWASPNAGPGTTFQFTLAAEPGAAEPTKVRPDA